MAQGWRKNVSGEFTERHIDADDQPETEIGLRFVLSQVMI